MVNKNAQMYICHDPFLYTEAMYSVVCVSAMKSE